MQYAPSMIMVEQIVPVRAISQKETHLLDVMVNLDWIKLEFYVIKQLDHFSKLSFYRIFSPILIFADGMYFLGKPCPPGSTITDKNECQLACGQLDIPLSDRKFKNGRPCYQGGSGVCNQNTAFGKRSKMVCKGECISQSFWIYYALKKYIPFWSVF